MDLQFIPQKKEREICPVPFHLKESFEEEPSQRKNKKDETE